ncbi:unnamed protein product, partial [Heterosigma akashiwo]
AAAAVRPRARYRQENVVAWSWTCPSGPRGLRGAEHGEPRAAGAGHGAGRGGRGGAVLG